MYETTTEVTHGTRISWGSIFAGVMVALIVGVILDLLGIAIGAGSINFNKGGSPFSGLGVGAGIWFAVSMIIALFIGGWVAGFVATTYTKTDGLIHGLTVGSFASLVSVFFIASMLVGIIGAAAGVAGKSLDLLGQAANAPGTGQVIDKEIKRAEQVAKATTSQDAQQAARQAGQAATRTTAQISWWLFAATLLGLIASAVGGLVAGPRPYLPSERMHATRTRTAA